ncbi:defensin beta 127 [Phyllostomus discolor]|uniref:Beta-defensin n=1 Tax=Phyllostomus discolor TaxID=89673 RepID=A0A6J2MJ63_9CHIR|nr:beta-defensin 127 [Phyllostomus discolor]KAF6087785.1 defensin beta 127 [Phyllostomus discolor]
MRLLLITAILLFQKPTVTEQLKKCWGQYIQGRCRKICRVSEIREVLCENGRYCCLNIVEVEARKKIPKPTRPKPMTYAMTLPQEYDVYPENDLIPKTNST